MASDYEIIKRRLAHKKAQERAGVRLSQNSMAQLKNDVDYSKFIIQKILPNDKLDDEAPNMAFDTKDFVYLPDRDSVEEMGNEKWVYATDYAILNGALQAEGTCGGYRDKETSYTWLRSFGTPKYGIVNGISYVGDKDALLYEAFPDRRYIGVRPAMSLDLKDMKKTIANNREAFRIGEIYTSNGNVALHTIELGEYPQSVISEVAEEDLYEVLEKAFQNKTLNPTGKKYMGYYSVDSKDFVYNDEYEFEGKKYVRINFSNLSSEIASLSSGGVALPSASYWVKVEPIKWTILNWDKMPKEINGRGDGTASEMELWSADAIIGGLPFYREEKDILGNGLLWQNSTVRGYLNGMNVNNIKNNGNSKYSAPNGGDFINEHNFLTEAFDVDYRLLQGIYDNSVGKKMMDKKKDKIDNAYGVVVEETPLSIKEQMKFYIENGKPFMLHGASGIGKTRRVEELDPNLVSLVLRKGMLPEEAIGKTIYPNNETSEGGIWKAPSWYVKLCEEAEKKGDEKQILFLDEITNSLYEQNLVFHLVLNRCIQPNLGHLPDNVVVVAAGNNQEESSSAYNMTEPLFRRFDGHIYLKPDIPEWLEWGSEESGKGDGRLKIHPLVSNFVSANGIKVFYSNYDRDNPPDYVLDPRGWEQVSDIIYDNNGVLKKELIENKVGNAIATNLIAFAKLPVITLQNVLDGTFVGMNIPTVYDEKLALALSLRHATEDEVGKVRKFVRERLGKEILATYDALWVGENPERAILVEELDKEHNKEQEKLQETMNKLVEEERKRKEENVFIPQSQRTKVDSFFAKDKHVTLDRFFDSEKIGFIHCKEEWQANILRRAFDNAGKRWQNGNAYTLKDNSYERCGPDACYSNRYTAEELGDLVIKYSEYEIFDFENVDFSKYISKKELVDLLPGGHSERDIFQISVDDFWDEKEGMYIRCDEEWKAKMLTSVFNRMGMTWANGDSYVKRNEYRAGGIGYGNNGFWCLSDDVKNNGKVYNFEDVDMTQYLENSELQKIKDTLPRGSTYARYWRMIDDGFTITLNEFWEDSNNLLFIHCDEQWKARYLMKAFSQSGHKWQDGDRYADRDRYLDHYHNTCYGNDGKYTSLSDALLRGRSVYKFEDVDIGDYLNNADVEDIKSKLPIGTPYTYLDPDSDCLPF